MVDVLLILWYTQYYNGWRTIDTLMYRVFPWLIYYWYFDILRISMVGELLIHWDALYFQGCCTIDTLIHSYFDGWRTIDTSIYSVVQCLAYYWYFDLLRISIVSVQLILWDASSFDGWRTIESLIFSEIQWLAYYWYFDKHRISMVGVLLILWDTPYFDCWRNINIWYTQYFDGWRTIDTLIYGKVRCLAYYWYFKILRISMVGVPLILWYKPYLDV